MNTLLVLEDDALVRMAIENALKGQFHVRSTASYDEAVRLVEKEEIDGAILDINLNDGLKNGIAFLQFYKRAFPSFPVLMESGYQDVATVVKCIKLGADDFIEKPFNQDTLLLKLTKIFSDHKKKSVLQRSYDKSTAKNRIIGSGEGIARAKRLVEQARDMRILFVGETGVGKTPFAWYSNQIMSQLEGQPRPFEQVNCAGLTPENFQDQLFGHKKGAFTSAIADKKGLVELAAGGDLFLDEIGDMPLQTQVLLLTFLDSMEYYRLGDDQRRKADVRIVGATNRNLKLSIQEGKFRKDLYSRISQVVVDIPPLRQQIADLPNLFEHFIQMFAEYAKPYDPAIVTLLQTFTWEEGNVRELRDAVEYMCNMSKDAAQIELEHLSDQYRPVSTKEMPSEAEVPVLPESRKLLATYGLEHYLNHVEKCLLQEYLKGNRANIDDMATELQVSKPTLYRRLRKYGIHTSLPEG